VKPQTLQELRRGASWSRRLPVLLGSSFAAVVTLSFFAYVGPRVQSQQEAEVARARELTMIAEAAQLHSTTETIDRLQAALRSEVAAIVHLSKVSPNALSASGSATGGGSGATALPPISIPTFSAPPATHTTTSASQAAG
jgi:hypothetical protein